MPQIDHISVRGAREHNLKNINVDIPRNKFVVLTGLSGSGKSSLAFDTIFAEGQRRYVESLSAYARQFLGQMEKPDIDHIDGLSPAISIDQKGTSRNPRSTVGTVTEIFDYMRLLFARIGHPHCPNCGQPITRQSVQQMADQIQDLPDSTRIMVLGPVIRDRKGEHVGVLDEIRRQGFVRVRIDGQVREMDETITLAKTKKHTIEVIVDRLVIHNEQDIDDADHHPDRVRLIDSLEVALRMSSGIAMVQIVDGEEMTFSEQFACPHCGISFGELEPRNFSFNAPQGACPECSGLGTTMEFDPELVMPNRSLSVAQGAIVPFMRSGMESAKWFAALFEAVAEHYDFSLREPIRKLAPEAIDILMYGSKGETVKATYASKSGRKRTYDVVWEGVVPNLKRRYGQTDSDNVREDIERFMAQRQCPTCKGARLRPEILAVTIHQKNIVDVSRLPIRQAQTYFRELNFDPTTEREQAVLSNREFLIARQVLKEINERLGFLVDVGLDYLTLERSANTLSGGEAQRIRLATQIGSSLMGVLYILDEPSIGLHQRDNARLIKTLERLRDIGNTLIVVEHDEDTMRAADWIVDIGPGAGEHGGYLVAEGPMDVIAETKGSITGDFLSGRRSIAIPSRRRPGNGKIIQLQGAQENNLQNVTVDFPLGTFTCVTGVSGSGKSSL
ncbi:MAG: excinuclease ABC subunit UvrA, partial [Thermomicrobiales bacterium]